MPDLPETLDRRGAVDLHGRNVEPWIRLAILLLTSFVSFHVPRARPLLNGRPVVLVEAGKPIDDNMRRERITLEELAAQARLQGLDSIAGVQWAVLETSGQISFIKSVGG